MTHGCGQIQKSIVGRLRRSEGHVRIVHGRSFTVYVSHTSRQVSSWIQRVQNSADRGGLSRVWARWEDRGRCLIYSVDLSWCMWRGTNMWRQG